MKVKSFLWNIACESIVLISELNLFHSVTVNGKNKFWKNVVLQQKV